MHRFDSIITVTGTKGKTTTVHVIEDVLRHLNLHTIKVDTTGHFVNGVRRSTLDDSRRTWRLVPTVCPGRYLWEIHGNPELVDGVAVFEAALGSSASSGLGYRNHKVGVFLNVFEDHIGSSDRIQSKDDIVRAKDFVFQRIKPGGWAVFNADDEYVAKALDKIPDSVNKLPVGFAFSHFDVGAHLRSGGVAITVDESGSQIVLLKSDEKRILADISTIPWSFGGKFQPSVWNLLSAMGAIYGYFDGKLPDDLRLALEAVRLDKYGGRLTLLQNQQGVKILADYAHEKFSLRQVAELARTMTGKGGRVIGVVRLAYDRTEKLIKETAEYIAKIYDAFVIYDKIDGYWRQPDATLNGSRFPQKIGYVSQMLTDELRDNNMNVERIIREDKAIQRAAEIVHPGDVVVVIVNDNIERSIKFIQDSFEAEFA